MFMVRMCGFGEVREYFSLTERAKYAMSVRVFRTISDRLRCDLPRGGHEETFPLLRHAKVGAFEYSPANTVANGGQLAHH